MAYKEFPDTPQGRKERLEFYKTDDGIALIEGWRRQGIKMEDIAKEYIGISVEAFRKWRKENPGIRQAIDVGTEICNAKVEKALYQRALGYDYDEETFELVEGEMRLTKRVTKHVPPETKAIMQWLFNKLPNQWRAIQEPLEATQYQDTVKEILVAMKEVAETGNPKQIEAKDTTG